MGSSKAPAKAAVETPAPVTVNDDWDSLVDEATDAILGSDLAKDDTLDALEGVPFLVTRVTFRPAEAGQRGAYVSCEALIAPKDLLQKRRVNVEHLPFDPGERVVFNDGGTGIYRQVVAYLHAKGFIALPEPVVTSGEFGTCSYDLPPNEWQDVHGGELRYTPTGDAEYVADIRLIAKRGIRISEYQNAHTADGKTRYLA